MKTRILVSLLVVPCALISALAAAPVPVNSQITAATVYTDRAIVTRTGTVELAAGEAEVTFEKLPAALMDQSLQVSGKGTAVATILDVNARTTYVEAAADARVKSLEDQIAAEQKKLRALGDRGVALDQQQTLIGKIENAVAAPPTKDSGATRPGFEEWQKLLTFSDEARTKLATERQALDAQREEVQAKIGALEAQLVALRGQAGSGRSYKTVTVRVAAANAGSLDLTLGYAVMGASWTPSYDARLRGEERAVELSYFGIVRQNTGEDWKGVALTLSTAKPGLGGGAPELGTWVVDVMPSDEAIALSPFSVSGSNDKRYRGMDTAGKRPLRPDPSSTSLGFGNGMALEAAPAAIVAQQAVATVDSSATSASFKIAAPATILSDNATQKVAITTITLAAKLQYQATPRLQETAFLSAYVTNSTDFPLLAGSVNTFLGDSFVATSGLKTVMPSEKFELALGADESIGVKRKVVNRFAEDTGLTGSGRRVTYEFLVTLTNNKKTTERVVFKELLPVSRNEKIVVKLIGPMERDVGTVAAPKEVTREADGKLVWRLDLKPGEKREIALKFSVEHPADVQVTGLE
ncbi:hypothetical protein CMV30_07260 [Nibricoccus aquaticus]|uniref:Mucoidy inhibitor MuiA family protein n=1 Tax=Nibricoccus aquaticus TaxID=2576891 RepID=A0A290QC05_9BACT|nr:mucoidy inhibitor MuiA family protein [Nibricoccus aquaticus]ATC63766.1 hypothetical protein CMV30_07260 [Nibricoccus aquaticus]